MKKLIVAFAQNADAKRANSAQALVRRVVLPQLDLERTAMWILGTHWRAASADQRRNFIAELSTLLVHTYTIAVTQFTDAAVARIAAGASISDYMNETVSYLPMRTAASDAEVLVRTRVQIPGGSSIRIDYRMREHDGAWKMFDVYIEGISLVMTHRATFGALAKRAGMDDLIRRLSAKNQESSAQRSNSSRS